MWVVWHAQGVDVFTLHGDTNRNPAQLLPPGHHLHTVPNQTSGCVCLPSRSRSPCRPNVAAINLCPKFFALGEPLGSKQVSALVHEMIHGLVSKHAGARAVDVHCVLSCNTQSHTGLFTPFQCCT